MSCGIGCRNGSDPMLLCLWCRLAAGAPIQSLAWEPPYASGAALKSKRGKKKKKKEKKKQVRKGRVGGYCSMSTELLFRKMKEFSIHSGDGDSQQREYT